MFLKIPSGEPLMQPSLRTIVLGGDFRNDDTESKAWAPNGIKEWNGLLPQFREKPPMRGQDLQHRLQI